MTLINSLICYVQDSQALSTHIWKFFNLQLFLSEYGFHPHTCGKIWQQIRIIFNPLSLVEKINL